MITLVYNTSRLYLYFDNELVGVNNIATVGSISNTLPVEFLGTKYYNHVDYDSPVEVTQGSLSNIALYNKALTFEEVGQNWQARQSMYNND